MKYYAVKKGKQPGIYNTWDECKSQVDGFSGAEYKKFNTEEEAIKFIGGNLEEQISFLSEFDVENSYNSFEESNKLLAYVDGSFDKLDGSYSYGAVIIKTDGIEKHNKRFPKDEFSEHRNVIGEIRGAIFAINYALENNYKELVLYYDYEGIEKWATGSWKRNKPATKSYHEFFQQIKDQVKVEFIKVQAHTGDKYNEMADKLAKEAKIQEE